MSKKIGPVYNSFITDIYLKAESTFVFLGCCNVISHISESAVLVENNLTIRKGVDITFSLFIMNKIELYLKNKSWMLLSPIITTGSYSENKIFMPLSPIWRNYPKIIINNGPDFYCGRLKKALLTKPCCSIHQL